MSLDHGLLNLPLAKRGDIDAQISKYKAEQAALVSASHKAALAVGRERAAKAKAALAELVARPDVIAANAERLEVTVKQLVSALRRYTKSHPQKVINSRDKWLA